MTYQVRPLRGARELLAPCRDRCAACDCNERSNRNGRSCAGDTRRSRGRPVITRDLVRYAKPDPDLFLAAADRLGVSIHESVVVGDSVWDLLAAQRARALSALDYCRAATARRNSRKPGHTACIRIHADLLDHLDEIGVRRSG